MRRIILMAVVAALLAEPAAAHVPAHCNGEGGATLAEGLEEMMIFHAEIEAALEAGANDSTIALMVFRLVRTDKRVLASLVDWLPCVDAAN